MAAQAGTGGLGALGWAAVTGVVVAAGVAVLYFSGVLRTQPDAPPTVASAPRETAETGTPDGSQAATPESEASAAPQSATPDASGSPEPEAATTEPETPVAEEPAAAIGEPQDGTAPGEKEQAQQAEQPERTAAAPDPAANARAAPLTGAAPTAEPDYEPRTAPALAAPGFDLVRVEPDGTAVIAGKGTPGSRITVLLDDTELDRFEVDASGAFVSFLQLPPSTTPRILTLLGQLAGEKRLSPDQIILAPTPAATDAPQVAQAAPPEPVSQDDEALPAAQDGAGEPARPADAPGTGTALADATTGGADRDRSETPDPATGTASGVIYDAPKPAPAGPDSASVGQAGAGAPAVRPDSGKIVAQDDAQPGAVSQGEPAQEAPAQRDSDRVARSDGVPVSNPAKPVTPPAAPQPAPENVPAAADVAVAPAEPPVVARADPAPSPAPEPVVRPAPDPVTPPASEPGAGGVVETAPEPSPRSATQAAPVAVLRAGRDGVELIQPATPAPPEAMDKIALDTISYSEQGDVMLSGRVGRGSVVRIYVNNRAVADLDADAEGRWKGKLDGVEPGIYTLRLDELDTEGEVLSRLETPFKREPPEALRAPRKGEALEDTPLIRAVTVQRGDTLWAISRERYGEGILYVRVFEANRDSIRNPDLIYPGQIFTIPD